MNFPRFKAGPHTRAFQPSLNGQRHAAPVLNLF